MALHILDLEQGSEPWFAARRGMVTASVVGQLLTLDPPDATTIPCPACEVEAGPCVSLAAKKTPTPLKTVHSQRTEAAAGLPPTIKTARNDTSRRCTLTLVAERITGEIEPVWVNDDMLRGQLDEPIARDLYQEHFAKGEEVTTTGFLIRDDYGFSIGASPDGLVGDDGGLEIKCPRAKGHIATILADEVPAQHMAQIQTSLVVSGRKWWDFMSHHGGLRPYVKRVYPDPRWHAAIVDAVAALEQRAEEMVRGYETRTEGLPDTERRGDPSEIRVA